jgi:DNA-binding MarR family transcriptional regulator
VVNRGDDTDELATKIVAALDRLARGQRSYRQAIASKHGLTPLQLDLLTTVGQGPPPEPGVGLLGTELGVTQPTITDSLQALEGKGLVTRRPLATDRRRTTVALTRTGRRVVDDLGPSERTLVDGIAALPHPTRAASLEVLLTLIARLVDAGIIDVARTCLTCRYYRRTTRGGHRCALLGLDLPPADLRVNCPEHQLRAPGKAAVRRLA